MSNKIKEIIIDKAYESYGNPLPKEVLKQKRERN